MRCRLPLPGWGAADDLDVGHRATFLPYTAQALMRVVAGMNPAREIVEAHGGRVWAESSPHGATFVFTLPVEPRRD